MKRRQGFCRLERVRRNSEYKRIHNQGASYRDGVVVVKILKNELGHNRLGVLVGASRVPLASRRNRIKRLVREFFRLNKAKIKSGACDLVVSITTWPFIKVRYQMVEQRLKKLLKKANYYD